MPDKAESKAQFRFLQGVKHGSIKSDSLTPDKAGELLGHQSPKGLPEKIGKKRLKFKK